MEEGSFQAWHDEGIMGFMGTNQQNSQYWTVPTINDGSVQQTDIRKEDKWSLKDCKSIRGW